MSLSRQARQSSSHWRRTAQREEDREDSLDSQDSQDHRPGLTTVQDSCSWGSRMAELKISRSSCRPPEETNWKRDTSLSDSEQGTARRGQTGGDSQEGTAGRGQMGGD